MTLGWWACSSRARGRVISLKDAASIMAFVNPTPPADLLCSGLSFIFFCLRANQIMTRESASWRGICCWLPRTCVIGPRARMAATATAARILRSRSNARLPAAWDQISKTLQIGVKPPTTLGLCWVEREDRHFGVSEDGLQGARQKRSLQAWLRISQRLLHPPNLFLPQTPSPRLSGMVRWPVRLKSASPTPGRWKLTCFLDQEAG